MPRQISCHITHQFSCLIRALAAPPLSWRQVATGGDDHTVRVWDLRAGRKVEAQGTTITATTTTTTTTTTHHYRHYYHHCPPPPPPP